MVPFTHSGRFSLDAGGRRVIRNALRQEAFDVLARALTGGGGEVFSSLAVLDGDGVAMSVRSTTFAPQPMADASIGIAIVGEAVFSSSDLPRPVEAIQLRSTTGQVLAEAPVDPPLPAGVSVVIERVDTFTPGV